MTSSFRRLLVLFPSGPSLYQLSLVPEGCWEYNSGGGQMADLHEHKDVVHSHTHHHVTHYLSHGQEWTHLMATHDHEHNHSPVEHIHQAHRDPEQEHDREAHIHDHAAPTESPA